MDFQDEFVAGKQKQVFKKRGQRYTRKGYDIRVETAERFRKKCDLLNEPESHIIEKLVEAFMVSTGWGEQVKQSPCFDPQSENHIMEAARRVKKGMFPWVRQN